MYLLYELCTTATRAEGMRKAMDPSPEAPLCIFAVVSFLVVRLVV